MGRWAKQVAVPRHGDGHFSEMEAGAPCSVLPPPQPSGASFSDPKVKRLNPIKRQQMEDRLHEIEEEITRAEAEIALFETELQSFVSADETQRQTQELARRKIDLQSLMKEWEELSGTLQ